MNICVDTAVFDTVYSWKIEVECSENTEHGSTGKHYVEMSDYVESIMEKYIHSCMSNGHT